MLTTSVLSAIPGRRVFRATTPLCSRARPYRQPRSKAGLALGDTYRKLGRSGCSECQQIEICQPVSHSLESEFISQVRFLKKHRMTNLTRSACLSRNSHRRSFEEGATLIHGSHPSFQEPLAAAAKRFASSEGERDALTLVRAQKFAMTREQLAEIDAQREYAAVQIVPAIFGKQNESLVPMGNGCRSDAMW